MPILLALLESKSLDVKISAGQAAALLFELIPQDCEVRGMKKLKLVLCKLLEICACIHVLWARVKIVKLRIHSSLSFQSRVLTKNGIRQSESLKT